MRYRLITPAATHPVSLPEAKYDRRLATDMVDAALPHPDDTQLLRLIGAATRHCEEVTGRAFIAQTWERALDKFPTGSIELPRVPALAITSVRYIDVDGVEQVISSVDYVLDNASDYEAWVVPVSGLSWPTCANTPNAVKVTYQAGYGTAEQVPDDIKSAILLLVGHFYENREAVNVGSIVTSMPYAVDALLAPYRVLRVY